MRPRRRATGPAVCVCVEQVRARHTHMGSAQQRELSTVVCQRLTMGKSALQSRQCVPSNKIGENGASSFWYSAAFSVGLKNG